MEKHTEAPHGPAQLLLKYWTALKAAIWALSSARPTNAFAESQVLVDVAEDLLETAQALRALARDLLQERLPLDAPVGDPPGLRGELSAFQERFPEISDDRAGDVIVAYQLIVALAPSLLAFPEILYAQIRIQLDVGIVGLDRALVLVELERHLRPARPSDSS